MAARPRVRSDMQPDFQRLFEAAPALFMVLAPDPPRYTVVAASDAYLRAVKKARHELVGHPVFDALPVSPDDPSSEVNSRASFQRVIDHGVPDAMVQRHDLARPAAEGGGFETHYWSAVNTPVRDEAGVVRYVLHRVEDVTELFEARRRSEEHQTLADALRTRAGAMELEIYQRAQEIQDANQRLRLANAKLGELDRAKTEFFSNVSHELRTPLTLILGTAELLLERAELAPSVAGELRVLEDNGLRLLKLVNTLLDFARIEAGRAGARYQPTELGTLTAELASSFDSVCEKGGVELRVWSPPTPAPVWVDREMWEKIVLNLLSNAFKFTLAGEIEVRLELGEQHAELTVRDTGSGIPPEELPRIFERFHRVASARGRSAEGTGIGLSLVHELVRLHGGTVEVESELGRGSSFRVRIPLGHDHLPAERVDALPAELPGSELLARPYVDEAHRWLPSEGAPREERPNEARPTEEGPTEARPSDGRPSSAAAPGEPTSPAPAAQRPRVLVVDDNPDMRRYVGRLLAPAFEVLTARDGEAALELARRDPPELLITDVMMPRMDGFALLRALRADPALRTTPVIMLSARAGEEAKGDGLDAGADDYLVKPFSARELVARVTTNLRLARMREEVARCAAQAEALRDDDQRKNDFLAMLSHELRNPLAPIRNSLYILQRSVPGGDQARRAQQVIERQVEHLSRMVEDLLDVSRITQGKMLVQKERLELGALVRGVVEDQRATFDHAGVALEAAVGAGPLVVRGDPTRLAQVVANLLSNAAKFTPRGGHARLSLAPDGDGTAVLAIADDGPGMQESVVEHLFEPFVQAERTIDRSAGGLGLGLAIVKGLVEAHGGRVSAASAGPGHGATIYVHLPLAEPLDARPSADGPLAPPVRPRRVLIVEDKPDAAESLEEALELDGHEVEVAHDGVEGLEQARRFRPDAILCDIGMPRMDGYEVARAIRADPALRGTCLVAVTGYAALEDVERAREAGFDHHVPKPPDLAELDRILMACEPRSDEAELRAPARGQRPLRA